MVLLLMVFWGNSMDDIKFSNFIQVVEALNDCEYLGKGYEGNCYRVGDKTYKFYNNFYCDLLNNSRLQAELLKFRDVLIENICFIRGLIFYNSALVGTITDYAVGSSCGKIYLHQRKIKRLVLALSGLKETIFKISELGICIDDDFFLPNILYDGKDFKLVDTGGWYYSSESLVSDSLIEKDDISAIYRKNMKKVMEQLFCNITGKYRDVDNFIYAFLWEIDSPYKYYLEDTDMMINPDETIIGIRNTICEYIGYEIESFSNCRKDLLRIRKRR